MEKQPLFEEILNPELVVLEEDKTRLPDGVLLRVKGQFGITEQDNLNHRTYENALWRNVLARKEILEKLNTRSLLGEADHPKELETSLLRVSHAVTKLWLDESRNVLMGEADILDTPSGRILNTLLRYGAKVGVSSRGQGAVIESNGKKIVDPSSYEYITHDFVLDPSCQGSFPAPVLENLAKQDYAEYQKDGGVLHFKALYEKVGIDLDSVVAEKTTDAISQTTEETVELKENTEREHFLEKRIEELASSLDSFMEQLKTKDQIINKRDITIEGLKETITVQRQKIKTLEAKKDMTESKLEIVKSLQAKLEEADTIRSRAERSSDRLKMEVSELKDRIGTLTKMNKAYQSENNLLKDSVKRATARYKKAEEALLEKRKDSHLYEVDVELAKRISTDNFDARLTDLKKSINLLKGKLDEAHLKEQDLTDKITNLEISNLALRRGVSEKKLFTALAEKKLKPTIDNAKLLVEVLKGSVTESPLLEGTGSVEIESSERSTTSEPNSIKQRVQETMRKMNSVKPVGGINFEQPL